MDLLPCGKQMWLEQEIWGTVRSSVDMLQKYWKTVGEQEQEAME